MKVSVCSSVVVSLSLSLLLFSICPPVSPSFSISIVPRYVSPYVILSAILRPICQSVCQIVHLSLCRHPSRWLVSLSLISLSIYPLSCPSPCLFVRVPSSRSSSSPFCRCLSAFSHVWSFVIHLLRLSFVCVSHLSVTILSFLSVRPSVCLSVCLCVCP